MSDSPDWERDGRDWPNREASRFVVATGLRWHVQSLGEGPPLLLVHGTGAATHSWRGLAPLLARQFRVIAPDLPGHGFTEMLPAHRLSLPGMASALSSLLRALDVRPEVAVGHSAGAAIIARMALDGLIAPRAIVALNAAMVPLRGAPSHIFMPLARALFNLPLVPRLFAWRAGNPRMVAELLRGTGSEIDAAGASLYGRLVARPGHVAGALGMMANWDLRPLERDLKRLRPPLILITGSNDRTVPPADSERVRALVPGASVVTLPGLGHLAHEEQPQRMAELIAKVTAIQRL